MASCCCCWQWQRGGSWRCQAWLLLRQLVRSRHWCGAKSLDLMNSQCIAATVVASANTSASVCAAAAGHAASRERCHMQSAGAAGHAAGRQLAVSGLVSAEAADMQPPLKWQEDIHMGFACLQRAAAVRVSCREKAPAGAVLNQPPRCLRTLLVLYMMCTHCRCAIPVSHCMLCKLCCRQADTSGMMVRTRPAGHMARP